MKYKPFLKSVFLFLFCSLYVHEVQAEFAFWVSPYGNDSNAGTKEEPFKTIARARDAVRELPSSAFKHHDVTVCIRNGLYRLKEPLELTSRDSGKCGHSVVYKAVPGERPVISGSIRVTNWELYDASLNVYRASVGSRTSRQLYVNGQRAERSRTTPYPVGFLPIFSTGGIDFLLTNLNPAAWRDPSTWTNPTDIEAVIETQWRMMRVPVSEILPSLGEIIPGRIVIQQPAWTNANVYFDKETNQPGIWSFWQVTRFENAYQFLNGPGQWCLDSSGGWIYYIPQPGEDPNESVIEFPILETLIDGRGTLDNPVEYIRFEGLTFSYATWKGPSGENGYVADQSGMILVGPDHQPNFIGHDQHVVPSHANLYFKWARHITFCGNRFKHLGGVGLHFDTGSQCNSIKNNLFEDISSSAIFLGGVSEEDAHPKDKKQVVNKNSIKNNLIKNVAVEYVDAAGIFVGFTRKTAIEYNTISNVPWSAIAMGWGWGLLDKGSFPGLPGAESGQWGNFSTLTPSSRCKIIRNRFHNFLNVLWDGGAIYTIGRQGANFSKGLLIKENVASGKRPAGGGNTYYTDGGSRYITLSQNVSFDNPIGETFFGPPPPEGDPLPYPLYSLGNGQPYGDDSGGCVTYGDICFTGNYWRQSPITQEEVVNNVILKLELGFLTYSEEGFFDICRATELEKMHPINLLYGKNYVIKNVSDIPQRLLKNAGVQKRPKTISEDEWNIE